MKSTYVGTRSANVGDIRCLFALASDSTSINSADTDAGADEIKDRCISSLISYSFVIKIMK